MSCNFLYYGQMTTSPRTVKKERELWKDRVYMRNNFLKYDTTFLPFLIYYFALDPRENSYRAISLKYLTVLDCPLIQLFPCLLVLANVILQKKNKKNTLYFS